MLDRWKELRAFLEQPKGFWRSSDRLKAIRLLGRNPVHAGGDRRVAEIFAATHALRRTGEAFDDLLTDMSVQAHDKFVDEIKARWTDLVGAGKPDKARQILIDLVDQSIEQIEAMLEEHGQNPEDKNGRSMDRLGVDKGRDGEYFLRYELRFSNAVKRGLDAFQKYQEKRKKYGRQRERDDVAGFEPAVPRRAPRGADGILGRAIDREPEPDLSWLPESGRASDTVVESLEDATAPGAPSPAPDYFEETTGREANSTNEANVDENVFLSQGQENDAVVADSEVVPGLDKLETKPTGGGLEEAQLSNPRAETSNPKSQLSNVDSSEPDEESGGGSAPLLSPRLPKRERRRRRKEMLRRAAERRLMAQLDKLPSKAAQLEYLIKEMRANSPADVDALLPLGMPRAP